MATIVGTNGNNPNLNGTAASDYIFGLGGDDTLSGFGSNDLLFGGSGNDQLFGGSGNDRLKGGTGNDLLNGGDGIDTADYSTFTIDPPGPTGPITTTGATAGVTVHLFAGDGDGTATGGAGNDTLVSIENLTGSKFNDTLIVDFFSGTLNGGNGNDSIDVAHFEGTVNGGAGNDNLFAGTSAGTLNGGTGNDHIGVDDGNFIVNGGAGNDEIEVTDDIGLGTTATVNGGSGADIITLADRLGNKAQGTCVYNEVTDSPTGTGRDVITGFDGASGDRIDLSNINVTGLSYAGEILSINTDADAAAEMQIQLIGAPPVFPYIII